LAKLPPSRQLGSAKISGFVFINNGGFKAVSVETTTVTGSSSNGVVASDSNVFVNITESNISGNGGSAVVAGASATTVNVDRTTIANNSIALNASVSGATIRSIGNNIFNNTTAFNFAGGGTIASDGQNRTGGNTNGQDANASVTLK
jgi:hypothetical protein